MSNLLNLGFNIPQLQAEKEQAIAIVQELFAELNKYDNTKISPISISGLTEMNAAVQQTNQTLTTLKTTVTEFSLAIQQYVKTSDEAAKVQAKISVSASEESQNLANLKVQLSEITREQTNQARSNNELYQSRQKQVVAEKEWQATFRQANAEAEVVIRKQIQLERQEAAEFVNSKKQEEKATRELTVQQIASEKEAQKEAKAILLESDAYRTLLLRQKELQSSYANLYASGQGKSIAAQGVLGDLGEVNGVIKNIDKGLESAGSGGATTFARALTSGLSQLRTIAYILPGIGIAGIFNLAFEAVESFFNGAENVHKALKDIIEDQIKYNSLLNDEISILKALDDAEEKRQKSKRGSVDIGQATVEFNQETGQSPESASSSNKLISEREYSIVQSRVQREFGDFQNLQKQIDLSIKQASDLEKSLEDLDNKRKLLNTKQTNRDTLSTGKVNPLKQANKENEDSDALDNLIKLRKDQITNLQTSITDRQKLLDKYISGEKEFSDKQRTDEKLLYDQERKKDLEFSKQEADKQIYANQAILDNILSTENERISAIQNIRNQNIVKATAENQFIQSDRDASGADKAIASSNLDKQTLQLKIAAQKQTEDIERDFYSRKTQSLIKATEDEITQEQIGNEKIYKDQVHSYEERIDALNNYIKDRQTAILAQYAFDVDKAKRETPSDVLPSKLEELNQSKNKQLLEVQQNVQQDISSIADSWYKTQLKVIQDSGNEQINQTVLTETEELKRLNESYAKKEVSLQKYSEKKQEIINKFAVTGDEEKFKNDSIALAKLIFLQDEVNSKLDAAQEKLKNAKTPQETSNATDEVQSLVGDKTDLSKQIVDKQNQVNNDQLKIELDKNKKIVDAKKDLNSNLIKLEKQLFETIQKVVDSNFDYRIEKIKFETQVYDEGVAAEEAGIQRSSLNQKDKNAYEVQLSAQKAARDKEAAKEERKLAHDKAVFDKQVSIAEIIVNTEIAVTGALAQVKTLGPLAFGLAISYAALGAAALATAIGTKIPAYAKGGVHKEEGFALFGEAGVEGVKEPNKDLYIATEPTVKYLPKGTEFIPMYNSPNISEKKYKDDSWAQTKYLEKAIKRGQKKTDNIIKANISISFKDIDYKNKVLHG